MFLDLTLTRTRLTIYLQNSSESTGSLLPTLATRHYISSQSLSPLSSTLFEHDGDALSAADAGRADAQLLPVLPQLVNDVAADARAGGGERVPDGDGAAAGVELLHWHLNSGRCRNHFPFFHGANLVQNSRDVAHQNTDSQHLAP